jgi:conjugal transfer pilin signal peptidase TrbI
MEKLMLLNQLGWKFGAIAGAVGLLALALVLMVQKPIPLVVVDMTRAIQKPSVMLTRTKLTSDAQLKIMERFSRVLPNVIKEYGQTHRVTIISATVLASHNTLDVTDEVVDLTISRMKHEG